MQKSLGAALYRKQDGQRRVIPYGSRALSATEGGKVWPLKKSQKTFFQNVDENSSATHKVFLRALERCSTIQMTASFVIVA